MEYLDIIMVCSPDRFLPQVVMDHILIQNIPFRLFFSNVKGDGAASARNFAKNMWLNANDQSSYVLMTDNDIIFPEGSIQSMIDFMDQNQDFGAIALHRREASPEVREENHVNAGPVLFRPEVYKQITYHNNNGCECQGMTDNIRELGHRIGYLPNYMYDHIENTRRDAASSVSTDPQPEQEPLENISPEEIGQVEPEEIGQVGPQGVTGNPEPDGMSFADTNDRMINLLSMISAQLDKLINETRSVKDLLSNR